MSELPPGSVDLEADDPPAPPVAPAGDPPPAAPVAAAPPQEEESVDVGGQLMVPLPALQAERRQRQELSVKAARVDQLEQEIAQLRPKAEFFDANRQIFERPAPVAAPPPPASADPDAIEAARLMDFYTADGSPDVERGARYLALQDRRAQKQADQLVQPLRQQTAQDQSTINFQKALQMKDADGKTPSAQSLQAVWRSMPAEYTADPRVAGILAATAFGLDRMATKSGPAIVPAAPPLVTEPAGGTPRNRPALTPLDESIARDRGRTPAQWAEHQSNYRPGRPTVLED